MTTIYDILKKRKALEVYGHLNGHHYKLPLKMFTADHISSWRRIGGRNVHLNNTVNCLYKMGVKSMFPDITREKLKDMLVAFTRQKITAKERKALRIEDLRKRKYRRLMPLTPETYQEISELGPIWKDVVQVATSLHNSTYVPYYLTRVLKNTTKQMYYQSDRRKYCEPTNKELKHA